MMDTYWSVMGAAVVESLWALPILWLVYFLIELIEYKWASALTKNHLLQGKASPLLGALLGSVPQCGFSVLASDLFAKRFISVGALLSVFIATSDEALPILIAHPQRIWSLLALIALKIIIALVIGYLANGLYRLFFKPAPAIVPPATTPAPAPDEHHLPDGCCHHHVATKKFDWLHPLLHGLKIFAFILVLNLFFSCLTEIWVGEARLRQLLTASALWQPLLALGIGLIPNCVASVVLTELYLMNGLKFSALLAGLCVNAGLGLIFMFKQNHHWRENLFVVVTLLLTGVAVGYGFYWLNI